MFSYPKGATTTLVVARIKAAQAHIRDRDVIVRVSVCAGSGDPVDAADKARRRYGTGRLGHTDREQTGTRGDPGAAELVVECADQAPDEGSVAVLIGEVVFLSRTEAIGPSDNVQVGVIGLDAAIQDGHVDRHPALPV